MNEYQLWASVYPEAAKALESILGATGVPTTPVGGEDKSEAWAQQRIRLQATHQKAGAWRNNVGATPAKEPCTCPRCQFKFEIRRQPVRYGLANDSPRMNAKFKSSDVILAIPRLITQAHVGTTIAQFGSVEAKRPGWKYTGTGQEPGQAAWLALIRSLGGFACFSTGDLEL